MTAARPVEPWTGVAAERSLREADLVPPSAVKREAAVAEAPKGEAAKVQSFFEMTARARSIRTRLRTHKGSE